MGLGQTGLVLWTYHTTLYAITLRNTDSMVYQYPRVPLDRPEALAKSGISAAWTGILPRGGNMHIYAHTQQETQGETDGEKTHRTAHAPWWRMHRAPPPADALHVLRFAAGSCHGLMTI